MLYGTERVDDKTMEALAALAKARIHPSTLYSDFLC